MVELTAGRAQPPLEERVFRLNLRRLSVVLWAASLTVITLGLFRELYVTVFGFETIAKDLRHLAFNAEYCLPAWYSSLVLVLSAALLSRSQRFPRSGTASATSSTGSCWYPFSSACRSTRRRVSMRS